jgi:hypothetical protein
MTNKHMVDICFFMILLKGLKCSTYGLGLYGHGFAVSFTINHLSQYVRNFWSVMDWTPMETKHISGI